MKKLTLPAFVYKRKKIENKVYLFDIARKKYVRLTPEEWVRQHMVHYLVNNLGYPLSLIKIEAPIQYGTLTKRADILVYSRGEPRALLLVECKAAHQTISPTHLMQAAIYNTAFAAPFIILSNGLQHFCFKTNTQQRTHTLLKEIPFFEQLNTSKHRA